MISVIIPAYNAEKTLARCLDSLIAQTHQDWEAICVDDGSKDSTASVLDDYSARDSRILAVHKDNAGVSEARNTALELVRGEYILFVDSDDFIHPQAMEVCLHLAGRENADIVAFTYSRPFHTRETIRQALHLPKCRKVKFPVYSKDELPALVTADLLQWSTEYSRVNDGRFRKWIVKHCQPWRCLYRTECIRNIKFIPGIIYEDFPWWSRVLAAVRRAVVINLPLYFYYPNFRGFIHSAGDKYKIESLKKAIETVEAEMPDLLQGNRYKLWEDNFLAPFKRKLQKKLKSNLENRTTSTSACDSKGN